MYTPLPISPRQNRCQPECKWGPLPPILSINVWHPWWYCPAYQLILSYDPKGFCSRQRVSWSGCHIAVIQEMIDCERNKKSCLPWLSGHLDFQGSLRDFFPSPIQPLFCHIRHRLNISQDGFMELFYLARSVIFGSAQREDWVLNKICQDISNPAHWLIIQWCYLQEIWFQRKINQCLWQPLLLLCIEHLQDVL